MRGHWDRHSTVLQPRINTAQYVSPQTTQYYWALFYFALESGRENMSDTHTAGVATALALCLTANRIATRSKSGTNEDHNTHTHTHKSRDKLSDD